MQAAELLTAGARWEDNDVVFSPKIGRPLGQGNVRRLFRAVCKKAKIEGAGNRVPYELRHAYASLFRRRRIG